jgi:probable acetyl-coA C-acyltransferase
MENQLKDAVIVAYGRSVVGKSGKKDVFRDVHKIDFVLKGVLEKVPELDPSDIDDFILGNAFPEGVQGENIGKFIGLRSCLPHSVPELTVNRCVHLDLILSH